MKRRTPSSGPRCGIVVSPQFATDHTLYVLADRVVRSSDGGITWHRIPLTEPVSALAISPDAQTIIAASDSGPTEISTADGNSWNQVANWQSGLPDNGFIVYDLRFVTPSTVLMATGDGVYRSVDGGRTWTWANNGLPRVSDFNVTTGTTYRRVPRVVGIANSTGGAAYAALLVGLRGKLYRSTDDGATWQLAGELPGRPSVLAADSTGENLFLGTRDAGIFESGDSGASWIPVDPELPDEDVAAIAFPAGANVPVVGTSYDGIFRLQNGRWVNGFIGLPQADPVLSLLVRHHDMTIYAGTISGIYRSTNSGASWLPFNAGLPGERSATVLAPLPHGDILAGTTSGLFRHSGGHWHVFGPGLTKGLSVWSVASAGWSCIAAGTENGLFVTANGGSTWRTAVTGAMNVTQIALDHSGMTYLDAGELDRLAAGHRTTIAGTVGGKSIGAFLRIGTRYMVATSSGIYLQEPHRWRHALDVSLSDAPIMARIGRRQILVAGAAGLFQSNDSGQTWMRVPVPGNAPVLAIAGAAGRVAVALGGTGIWRYGG